ncbi:unnamed protein product [Cyprideis torosa]|uniref:Uncharacterized protein n=1 Tax=Cyprideis torosa TaxID=163714 RepID=A0A7R8WGG5_9CRUS|nr:unnamed protein product [Cyprideis torosa]CAG0891716.1 unnamed protein product [Cyprideis torosa]
MWRWRCAGKDSICLAAFYLLSSIRQKLSLVVRSYSSPGYAPAASRSHSQYPSSTDGGYAPPSQQYVQPSTYRPSTYRPSVSLRTHGSSSSSRRVQYTPTLPPPRPQPQYSTPAPPPPPSYPCFLEIPLSTERDRHRLEDLCMGKDHQKSKLNCEVLRDDLALEVRWAVAGESIVIQLVGRLEDKQYVAFGLSGAENRARMVGADVTVAWMEHESGKGFAEDYYLGAKARCAGSGGSCSDTKIEPDTNNVRLLNTALVNGFTMITYQRPLVASDDFDKSIEPTRNQSVVWAVGRIDDEGTVSYHNDLRNSDPLLIQFGRSPEWNCPVPEEKGSDTDGAHGGPPEPAGGRDTAPKEAQPEQAITPWYIPPIPCHEPEDGVFYVHMGPTGGEQGYSAITKRVGWGIAWYINGLLIPEIYVVRGKTYTFVVEGGDDPSNPAKFHPFYITDDPDGGYEYKTPEERRAVNVYSGVSFERNGKTVPTGFGRACEWKEDPDRPARLFRSFGAYQRSLTLQCKDGQPGIVQWTPDRNTPDLVYYQCYTHRHLGWKIHVLDSCDGPPQEELEFAGSQQIFANVTAPVNFIPPQEGKGEVFREPNVKADVTKPPEPRDEEAEEEETTAEGEREEVQPSPFRRVVRPPLRAPPGFIRNRGQRPPAQRPPAQRRPPVPQGEPESPPPQSPAQDQPSPGRRIRPQFNQPQLLPFASNNGFDPNTVIIESGFRPIRKESDPLLPPGISASTTTERVGPTEGSSGPTPADSVQGATFSPREPPVAPVPQRRPPPQRLFRRPPPPPPGFRIPPGALPPPGFRGPPPPQRGELLAAGSTPAIGVATPGPVQEGGVPPNVGERVVAPPRLQRLPLQGGFRGPPLPRPLRQGPGGVRPPNRAGLLQRPPPQFLPPGPNGGRRRPGPFLRRRPPGQFPPGPPPGLIAPGQPQAPSPGQENAEERRDAGIEPVVSASSVEIQNLILPENDAGIPLEAKWDLKTTGKVKDFYVTRRVTLGHPRKRPVQKHRGQQGGHRRNQVHFQHQPSSQKRIDDSENVILQDRPRPIRPAGNEIGTNEAAGISPTEEEREAIAKILNDDETGANQNNFNILTNVWSLIETHSKHDTGSRVRVQGRPEVRPRRSAEPIPVPEHDGTDHDHDDHSSHEHDDDDDDNSACLVSSSLLMSLLIPALVTLL